MRLAGTLLVLFWAMILGLFSFSQLAIAVVPQPPQPSHTSNGTFQSNGTLLPCGLYQPSQKDWDSGAKQQVVAWVNEHWKRYKDSGEESFPFYMARNFAPDLPKSSVYCDGLGKCLIGDCGVISDQVSQYDRQMAFYVFEAMSNIDHYLDILADSTKTSVSYVRENGDQIVRQFTFAEMLQDQAIKRKQAEEIAVAAITAVFLIGTGAYGVRAVGNPAWQRTNAIGNLISSTFIGESTLIMKSWRDNPHLVADVQEHFRYSWIALSDVARSQITKDSAAYFSGDPTTSNMTFIDLIASGNFVEPDISWREDLQKVMDKYFMAVAINGLWALERTYIVDANVVQGACESDDRGPPRNRICLPERPDRSYWLYNIDRSQENDALRNHQATVKTPRGLKRILEHGANYRNITAQDIVRSSLWVHENKLKRNISNFERPLLPDNGGYGANNSGSVPGAFTIAICRNPAGEAISSVWSKHGRNYPCRCGEFDWETSPLDHDQTQKFLLRSKLYASEDFEDFCDDHHDCHEDRHVSWKFEIEEGMPAKAKHLKHPYWSCKGKGHGSIGDPSQDD